MRLTIDGHQEPGTSLSALVTRVAVGSRYFDTLGLTLARGRAFADADGSTGHEVAVVNQRLASMYFPNEDPVGHRIRLTPDSPSGTNSPWITIVGVSPTIRQRHLREADPDPVVYVPYRFAPAPSMAVVVRTPGEPSAMTRTLQEAVRVLDPDLPLFGIATLDQTIAQRRWFDRVFGTMFAAFAAVALMLSAVGLYAMTAYAVTHASTRSARIALGARPRQVQWLFVGQSLRQLALGLTLGLAGALGAGRLLRSLLAQASANDAVTLAAIAAVFVTVTLAACYWPARRATAVDPTSTLHCE